MRRTAFAAVALVGGLWVAAHYPDLAWIGAVGVVIAYLVAPGGHKSKSKH